jgi:hypothetical protein
MGLLRRTGPGTLPAAFKLRIRIPALLPRLRQTTDAEMNDPQAEHRFGGRHEFDLLFYLYSVETRVNLR